MFHGSLSIVVGRVSCGLDVARRVLSTVIGLGLKVCAASSCVTDVNLYAVRNRWIVKGVRKRILRSELFSFHSSLSEAKHSGGYCGGVPPLPIPNREVKPACADGTAMQCGRVGGRHLFRSESFRQQWWKDSSFVGMRSAG